MAGLGRRTFAPGEVLTASNVMNYLQDQVIQNYAGTAARGSAIGSAVSQGMVSYLDDSNSLEVYKTTGTAVAGWEPVNLTQSPNVIINGGFDIWQRGTAINAVANTAYTADMWSIITDNVGTVNATRQNIAAQGIGSQYALRAERSAGTNRWVVIGMFEGALSYVGRNVTLSFYIRKGSALTSDISVSISARTVKFGTAYDTSTATISNSSINSSTFTRYTITFPITTATSTAGADFFELEISANQAGASNAFFELAGVQLEAGQTATPFRRNANSIQGELAACQRYLQILYSESLFGQVAVGWGYNATSTIVYTNLKETMRVVPTSLGWSGLALHDNFSSAPTISTVAINTAASNTNILGITVTSATGIITARPYWLGGNNTGAGVLILSSEL
jgi:hypothetical protein